LAIGVAARRAGRPASASSSFSAEDECYLLAATFMINEVCDSALQAGVEAVKDILETAEHGLQPNMRCCSFTAARNEIYLIYKVSYIPLQSLKVF
jgi:hypothetical protein